MSVELPIYLDNHATTRVDPRVVDAMLPFYSEDYGNAASKSHAFGWRAEAAVEIARETLANAIGAGSPREVVFTSGATESNNLALKGVAEMRRNRGDHLVTVATEHASVLDPCRYLESRGFRLTVLPVDRDGLVDPEAVRQALSDATILVSVMAANNEIGVLQPLEAIGAICREREVLFHTDAVQALGKVPVDVDGWQVDLLSVSAHKLYGPKGVGALYVRRRRPRLRLVPLLHGGGHERGLRSGTLPVPSIVGFGRALALCEAERAAEARRLQGLRERLRERLQGELAGVRLLGHATRRLPGNLNVAFEGVDADALIVALHDVAVSSGSACTSATPEPSHVVAALGLERGAERGSVRFGLGRFNTQEEIDYAASRVIEEVRKLRGAAPS
ncbi:MAG: cysteine desulfurase [Deltaproteobacteria bacterium]|nr:MAG: cysteine desulfurase [Deltaproteobacteria bacterium]